MSERELPPLPDSFQATRESLHRVAEDLVKVAREHSTGEFSLAQTPGGFGTPPFGDEAETRIRVEGADLVVSQRGRERRAPITSLAAAAELIGSDLLPPGVELPDQPLDLDEAAAMALAEAYAVGQEALERIRAEAGAGDDPTDPTLWPEHFDLAIEMGPEGAGLRCNYGLSPGDENHRQPYFYVGPWTARPAGPLWNGDGFPGAELSYRELRASADPVGAAVEFALTRKSALENAKEEG